MFAGATLFVRNSQLHHECEIEPLLLYLERRATQCFTQYEEHPNNSITNVLNYIPAHFP
jgi:hypothetical protein